MKSKVIDVIKVTLEIQKTNPPTLIINAKAEVSNARWSKGELVPFVYKKAPPDGIYEFDFIAEAQPDGIVPEPIVEMDAKPFDWKDFPSTLLGVKVYASSNHIVALIEEQRQKLTEANNQSFNQVTPDVLKKLKSENDIFFITNAFIWEDVLHLSVRYGGGCKKHNFQLVWDGTEMESFPPQIPLTVIHNNNEDHCKAIVTEELQFVLSEHIKTESSLILEGWEKKLSFKI